MAINLLMRARQLAAQYQFSIIPVARASKQPAERWKEFQSRRSTEREWRGWFGSRCPCNLGIVTGAVSGIVVVDVDSDAGREYVAAHLPPTPMRVTTGGGGEHHYYRHPGGVVSNKVRLPGDSGARVEVDVRADGGGRTWRRWRSWTRNAGRGASGRNRMRCRGCCSSRGGCRRSGSGASRLCDEGSFPDALCLLLLGTDYGDAGHERPVALVLSLPALRSPLPVWRAVRTGEVEA